MTPDAAVNLACFAAVLAGLALGLPRCPRP
jgi:hypothetical protein